MPRPRQVVLAPAVLALRTALDDLASVDLAAMSGTHALAQAKAVLVESQRLQLLALGHLAEVDRRELFALDGATGTGRWVEGLPVGADRASVAVARRLSAFPRVASRSWPGGSRWPRPSGCRQP